jgi:hypothetical protein
LAAAALLPVFDERIPAAEDVVRAIDVICEVLSPGNFTTPAARMVDSESGRLFSPEEQESCTKLLVDTLSNYVDAEGRVLREQVMHMTVDPSTDYQGGRFVGDPAGLHLLASVMNKLLTVCGDKSPRTLRELVLEKKGLPVDQAGRSQLGPAHATEDSLAAVARLLQPAHPTEARHVLEYASARRAEMAERRRADLHLADALKALRPKDGRLAAACHSVEHFLLLDADGLRAQLEHADRDALLDVGGQF